MRDAMDVPPPRDMPEALIIDLCAVPRYVESAASTIVPRVFEGSRTPLDQLRHRLPRPQVERQHQLIRHPADNQRASPRGLLRILSPAASAPAPLAWLQCAHSAFSGQPHPLAHRAQAHAKCCRSRSLRHSVTYRLHHQLPQVGLRRAIQFPGINSCTHAHLTHYALFGAPVSNTKYPRRVDQAWTAGRVLVMAFSRRRQRTHPASEHRCPGDVCATQLFLASQSPPGCDCSSV